LLDVYVLHCKNDEFKKRYFLSFWEQIVTFSISTFKVHSFVMYSCRVHKMFHIKNITKMAVYIKNGHLMHIDPKLYIKCPLDNYLI
jgi:hypothetical protein